MKSHFFRKVLYSHLSFPSLFFLFFFDFFWYLFLCALPPPPSCYSIFIFNVGICGSPLMEKLVFTSVRIWRRIISQLTNSFKNYVANHCILLYLITLCLVHSVVGWKISGDKQRKQKFLVKEGLSKHKPKYEMRELERRELIKFNWICL